MQKRIVTELQISPPPHNRGKSIINCWAGNRSCPVKKPSDQLLDKNSYITVSRNLAGRLHIPAGSYLIYHPDRQDLHLGPIIGILNSALRPGGRPGPYEARIYKEMIKYARKRGVLIYLFNARGAGIKNGLIKGVTLDQAGDWVNRVFPRPDIVYNRIRKRRLENSPEIVALLKHFEADPEIYLFNSRFLHKWEVYQAVSEVSAIYSLFPLTLQFNRKNLETMLANFSEVLLKPDHGSLGKGIIKIVVKSGRFKVAKSSDPSKWHHCASIDELYTSLTKKISVNGGSLLQRVVELCTLQGNVFDIRTQFQKDGGGNWVNTGAAVRVAGKDQFVTHIPNGGRAAVYDKVIRRIFPNPAIRSGLKNQLDFIGSQVPALLEERLGINLAIVSMDIAIDPQGKMWILEVNSKPSHFDEPDIRRRHLQLLIDYCIYAAAEHRKKLTERSSL